MFNDHDPIVTMVSLDNNLFLHTDNYANIEVGAFVEVNGNEDYRGHGFMNSYEAYGDPYPVLEMEIYYQPLDNENESSLPVHFKMYDHGTGTLYDYFTCDKNIVTQTMYNTYNFSVMPTISFFHTFTKEINPYTENGGYYLIASPLNEAVNASDVIGLRTPEFDFYSFDQNQELEWINHRNEENYQLQSGKGYLYANSTGEDLIFVGAPYNGDGSVTLEKYEGTNVEFSGWNLVGNPFAQTAYIDRDEFYVMKQDGSEIIVADRDTISAMEGIFVIAQNDGESVTFSATAGPAKGQIVLNVTNRGNVIDRAIVRFGQGGTLPKFMLNQNNTKMYLSKDGEDFAVVRSNRSGSLPVNFEPAKDGTYISSGLVQNMKNVRYLHLIDNELGTDVDLLRTPEYKFEAKTVDRSDRFVLVFSTSNVFNTKSTNVGNEDDFGFFSNGNWVISNEGEAILQVVDVNGRVLSSEEINGSVSKRIEAAPGIYMLRLINGKDMKVQKIVVE